MLKSLHIGRYVGDPKDLRILAEFLSAIGFDAVAGEDGRSAVLSAPLALLSLNSLPKEYPAEVRERLKDVNRVLVIEVTNPDAVFEIAQKRKFKLLADTINAKTNDRSFSLELPGEIVLTIHGRPEAPADAIEGQLNAAGKHFAIVVSRFNAFITERLLQGAYDGLLRSGANRQDIALVRVPGAFEIPSAARTLAETRKYDAILCIGCLLRGDTAHYDVIVNEVTRGIGQSAQETGVPHAFGVLTCETLEQAIDRAGLKMGNKGLDAALAAVEMANLRKAVVGRGRRSLGKALTKAKARSRSAETRHAQSSACKLIANR
jgi:6,7-dimethyl-8-ribityllumazine synthase